MSSTEKEIFIFYVMKSDAKKKTLCSAEIIVKK